MLRVDPMSLRNRLLIVIALLLATYAVAAVVIVSTQRDLLLEQVDRRLTSLPPGNVASLAETLPVPAGDDGGEGEVQQGPTDNAVPPGAEDTVDQISPFSELFVAVVQSSGAVATLLLGPLPGDGPDIGAAMQEGGGIVTVDAVDGSSRFRVLVLPQPETGDVLIVAQSLAEIDASLARLVRTLWIAGAITAIVLGIAFVWIQRLGLRPIARVTAVAEAIAGGDRTRRVTVADEHTEAGKLGHAFNVMLDERDAGETRLRQFIADASHELRTPLTSVRGYLELYRQGAFRDPGQLDDVVRRLSAESARMHGLVEDLLALASLDEDRPLRREQVDLGPILRDAAQDAQATQPDRSINVNTPESGPTVSGDEALLTQLVGILVANALAHTPITAPVTLTAESGPDIATIAVADGGPGLDPEAAAHVFDRFWRGEAARTRTHGSTGLGLAIARSIVDAHGGTIALDTAPGEGCTFTIHLPVSPIT